MTSTAEPKYRSRHESKTILHRRGDSGESTYAWEDGDGPTPQDRAEGYRYQLATAASLKVQGEIQYVSNLNGQIGIVYDFKNGVPGSREGVAGNIWRGKAPAKDEVFSIKLEDIYSGEAYMNQLLAYDATGKDRAVTLQDQNHTATSWKQVKPKEEWFKSTTESTTF